MVDRNTYGSGSRSSSTQRVFSATVSPAKIARGLVHVVSHAGRYKASKVKRWRELAESVWRCFPGSASCKESFRDESENN